MSDQSLWQRVVPVVISVVVIVTVALVQERSRSLAAILATMPLSAPLAMWIVNASSNGDLDRTASFTVSLVAGILATLAFVVACWFALRRHWPFPFALAFGAVVWFVCAFGPALAFRLGAEER